MGRPVQHSIEQNIHKHWKDFHLYEVYGSQALHIRALTHILP